MENTEKMEKFETVVLEMDDGSRSRIRHPGRV